MSSRALRLSLPFAALGLVFGVPVGCGGSVQAEGDAGPSPTTTTTTTTTPTTTSTTTPTTTPTTPPTTPSGVPARPPIDKPGSSASFAADRVFLGTRDRSGKVSSMAWRSFGFDLDGRATSATDSKTSTNVCRRVPGSPSSIATDGDAGIDNNFGAQLMSVLKSLKSDFEDQVTSQVLSGDWTWVLVLEDLGGDDDAKVPGRLYLGRRHPGAPTFTTADRWPVRAEVAFPNGYTSKGTWVSGSTSFALPIVLTSAVEVPLEGGLITFGLADGKGVIGGGAPGAKLVTALTPALKATGICPGNATFDQVVMTLTQSVDLVSGAPSLQDPTKTCDALSIGLGFHASPTGAPVPGAAEPPPLPSDCL